MDQQDTAREVHPIMLFNRPDLGSGQVRKDFRATVVSVNDELPSRPAPAAFAGAVEVVDPKKPLSSATSSVEPSGPDSNGQTIQQQTITPTGTGEIPAPVVKDSPDLIRPPLQ